MCTHPNLKNVMEWASPYRIKIHERCAVCLSRLGWNQGETTWLKCESVSHSVVLLFGTPWIVARQAPLSVGFARQEYWSGLPFSSPRHLPNPVIEPGSPALQTDSLLSEPPGKPS